MQSDYLYMQIMRPDSKDHCHKYIYTWMRKLTTSGFAVGLSRQSPLHVLSEIGDMHRGKSNRSGSDSASRTISETMNGCTAEGPWRWRPSRTSFNDATRSNVLFSELRDTVLALRRVREDLEVGAVTSIDWVATRCWDVRLAEKMRLLGTVKDIIELFR